MHDLRLAIRALCAAPLVSVAAIVSLTVSIGGNTAVFSVVNAILLKPAPYPEPDRLVLLGSEMALRRLDGDMAEKKLDLVRYGLPND